MLRRSIARVLAVGVLSVLAGLYAPAASGAVGTVTPLSTYQGPPCSAGQVCTSYTVTCSGTAPMVASVARSPAKAPARGVIVSFSGSEGLSYLFGGTGGKDTLAQLKSAGFTVLQTAWKDRWTSLPRAPFGLDTAGCRPAALLEYLHDTVYVPLGLSPGQYVCGFCVTGNSTGSTLAAYPLSDYGLDRILDAAVFTSGPMYAGLAETCLNLDPAFRVPDRQKTFIDYAYGYTSGGPCSRADMSMRATFDEDGILHGGTEYVHPATRVAFQTGGRDLGSAPANAAAYADKLNAAGSPCVTEQTFPNAEHGMSKFLLDPAARAGYVAAFTTTSPEC